MTPNNPETVTPSTLLDLLTNLPPGATLELKKLPTGEFSVADTPPKKTKAELIEEKYAHLKGQPVTVSQAVLEYGVPKRTILNWKNCGYITVLDEGVGRPGSRITLDHADVAACFDVYSERKESSLGFSGVPLFHPDGTIYQLKHRDLAEYRRAKRQKQAA
jgi:hypothetical protein